MNVTLTNGKNLQVKFQYSQDQTETRAEAYFFDEPESAFAVAFRHPGDRFVKSVGRRLALNRLMNDGLVPLGAQDYVLSREDRRRIWTQYWVEHRDLRTGRKA